MQDDDLQKALAQQIPSNAHVCLLLPGTDSSASPGDCMGKHHLKRSPMQLKIDIQLALVLLGCQQSHHSLNALHKSCALSDRNRLAALRRVLGMS